MTLSEWTACTAVVGRRHHCSRPTRHDTTTSAGKHHCQILLLLAAASKCRTLISWEERHERRAACSCRRTHKQKRARTGH